MYKGKNAAVTSVRGTCTVDQCYHFSSSKYPDAVDPVLDRSNTLCGFLYKDFLDQKGFDEYTQPAYSLNQAKTSSAPAAARPVQLTEEKNINLQAICRECLADRPCDWESTFQKCFQVHFQTSPTKDRYYCPECDQPLDDSLLSEELPPITIHDIRHNNLTTILKAGRYRMKCPVHGLVTPIIAGLQSRKKGQLTPRLIFSIVKLYWQGKKPKLIAEAYGVSVSAVTEQRRLAAQELTAIIQKQYVAAIEEKPDTSYRKNRPQVEFLNFNFQGSAYKLAVQDLGQPHNERAVPDDGVSPAPIRYNLLAIYPAQDVDRARSLLQGYYSGELPSQQGAALSCLLHDTCCSMSSMPSELDYYYAELVAEYVRCQAPRFLREDIERALSDIKNYLLRPYANPNLLHSLTESFRSEFLHTPQASPYSSMLAPLEKLDGQILKLSQIKGIRKAFSYDPIFLEGGECSRQQKRLLQAFENALQNTELSMDEICDRLFVLNPAVLSMNYTDWYCPSDVPFRLSADNRAAFEAVLPQADFRRGLPKHCFLHLLKQGILNDGSLTEVECICHYVNQMRIGKEALCNGKKCPFVPAHLLEE